MQIINLGTKEEACHYVANELLKQIISNKKCTWISNWWNDGSCIRTTCESD